MIALGSELQCHGLPDEWAWYGVTAPEFAPWCWEFEVVDPGFLTSEVIVPKLVASQIVQPGFAATQNVDGGIAASQIVSPGIVADQLENNCD